MVDDLRAAVTITRAIFRAKAKHPVELALGIVVNSLDVITPVLAFTALTHTFGSLGGWQIADMLLLLGTANACLGLCMLVMGAFDSFLFLPIFRSGQLESALLRPGNTVTFLAASNIRPYRLGRVIASSVTVVAGLLLVDQSAWTLALVVPLFVVVGSAMLSTLWMLDAGATMRFGQQNDFTRNLAFVGVEMSYFPHGLYPPAGRFIAQFVFGVGAAAYLPISYFLGKGPNFGLWSLMIAPALLPVMILGAYVVWQRAIARLEVTGAQ